MLAAPRAVASPVASPRAASHRMAYGCRIRIARNATVARSPLLSSAKREQECKTAARRLSCAKRARSLPPSSASHAPAPLAPLATFLRRNCLAARMYVHGLCTTGQMYGQVCCGMHLRTRGATSGHLDESSCSCASLGAQACFLSTLFCHWRGPRPTLQQRRSRAPARLLAIPAPQRAATPRHLAASSPQPRCAHRP